MLSLKWWDFPKEIIQDNISIFKSDIDEKKLDELNAVVADF